MSRLNVDERTLESVTEEMENVDIDDDEQEEEEEIAAPDPKLLKSQFRLFAKFGDTGADGSTIKGRFRSWSAASAAWNNYNLS